MKNVFLITFILFCSIFSLINSKSELEIPSFSSEPCVDLVIDITLIENSISWDYVSSGDDPCLVVENCLGGYGRRKVVRFSSKVYNLGTCNLVLGPTPSHPKDSSEDDQPPWHFSHCPTHNHWHFQGYANYQVFASFEDQFKNSKEIKSGDIELIKERKSQYYQKILNKEVSPIIAHAVNMPLSAGHKNGWCVQDSGCIDNKYRPHFDCNNQGITRHCFDIYADNLQCQWIDVTGLNEDQEYILVISINPDQEILEIDYTNNDAVILFKISDLNEFMSSNEKIVITIWIFLPIFLLVVVLFIILYVCFFMN